MVAGNEAFSRVNLASCGHRHCRRNYLRHRRQDYGRGYLMNIPIIAGSISGIALALACMGYADITDVAWNRSPVRIDGVWHAEVRHG